MKRPLGIVVVSALMILFGFLEVVTGFSHNFAGISTSTSVAFTLLGASIGAFYSIAGLLTLTMNRWAVLAAVVLLVSDIIGRLGLVASGLFLLDSTANIAGIVGGTSIAAVFAVYLSIKMRSFFDHQPMVSGLSRQPKN